MTTFHRRFVFAACLVILTPVFDLATATQAPNYQPDLRVADVARTDPGDAGIVRAGRFKGNGVYEPVGSPDQELVLEGAAKETQTFLIMVQNDGDATDEIMFRLESDWIAPESRAGAPPFQFEVYTAEPQKRNLVRGEDVTKAATDKKGIIFELKRNRERFFWLEVTGRKSFKEGTVVQFRLFAVSRRAAAGALTVSESSLDTVLPPVRDQYLAQFGSGEIPNADEFDLTKVTFLNFNISRWPITSHLDKVTVSASQICMPHTKRGQWPIAFEPDGDVALEGNTWIVAQFEGVWYAAIFEWMEPGGLCKSLNATPPASTVATQMASHIFFPPLRNAWVPKKGEISYVFVSAVAWPGFVNPIVFERTQAVKIVWP